MMWRPGPVPAQLLLFYGERPDSPHLRVLLLEEAEKGCKGPAFSQVMLSGSLSGQAGMSLIQQPAGSLDEACATGGKRDCPSVNMLPSRPGKAL